MFDKIKRAISGWGQDSKPLPSPQLRPASPVLAKKDRSSNFRNSLPARFRPSLYRSASPSSSSEVLPLPPPKDIVYRAPRPARDVTRASTFLGDLTSVDSPIDKALASSPRSPFIKRTSSFQSQRGSTESFREESYEEDIIIFSSTPPVTIARSSSVKIPRTGAGGSSFHKGSPDQLPSSHSSLNQETPVVQWPRGGASSAANRSQERFLRTHRRASTSSDASLKDLQPQMATTPPVSSTLRQDLLQRPPLARQHSRPGSINSTITTSTITTTTTLVAESHHTHTVSHTSSAHLRTHSDVSTESNTYSESHGAASTGLAGSGATPTVSTSYHMHQVAVHEHHKEIKDIECITTITPTEVVPQLNPTVAKQLATGTQMLKISAKKQHPRLFKLDLEQGRILWDSRKVGRINVEQIKELRKGKAARMYREQLRVKPELEERWLTIIYSAMGKYKTLHLVAPTKDTYHDWIVAVEIMWSVKQVTDGLPQLQRKTNQWLQDRWMDADKNVDSKLGYEEIVRLCYRLNINFSRKEIRLRFEQADVMMQGYLGFAEFTLFVKLLKERKEILELFSKVAKDDSMTVEEFTSFMINIQKTSFDVDHIKEIYGKNADKTAKFTVDSFTSFLISVDNSIVSQKHAQVHQDMSQTLSNYYISSSHNTYLLGHQLTGHSSIEGYIRALQSGCRCVELDCWDGSDGQPIVYHGRTLTSKILFRDVIEAISTYAFVNSPYPLILSLELHCDLAQQEIMANIMKTKLGSWLVVAPLDNKSVNLPSPDDLQFKILVKCKVLPPDSVSQEYSTDTESESEKEGESDSESVKPRKTKTKTKKVTLARSLSDLAIYCQSRHFPGFTHEGCSPFKIISFSERVSTRLGKQSQQEYINLNKTHLTRIYPAGFRINSTNYDPHNHWSSGAQVVALNYQTHDRGMQMNSAMFNMNGHCGYVLKPQPLRLGPDEVCNHDKAPSFVKSHPVEVTLEIISAQQLPRPNEAQTGEIVDPACEIELLIPGQASVKAKTRPVNDNGFNPMWGESFTFRVDYEHHELVFFRFVVQDEDIKLAELLASYCISLDCLEEGYRHIQLHGPSGDLYLYSTLFVKVSIVPVGKGGYLAPEGHAIPTTAAMADLPPLPPLPPNASNGSSGSRSSTDSSHCEAKSLSERGNGSSHSLLTLQGAELESELQRPLPALPGKTL
ncbi:Phospholipase C [Dissophora ornata]|nr:Phospholipase C [Dissophora ornata]